MTASELLRLARAGRVKEIRLAGQQFAVLLDDGSQRQGFVAPGEDLREMLEQVGGVDVAALLRNP